MPASRRQQAGSAPRRHRLTRAARRDLIVQAAAEVFAANGYRDASMELIAGRAGVTAPVLYDHFDSKQALYLTLLDEHGRALLSRVLAGATAARTAADALRAGIDAFLGFVQSHPFAWRMLFRDPPADPVIAEQYARRQAATTTALAAALRAGGATSDEGPRAEQTGEVYAEMLRTGLNGVAAWWYDHPDVPRAELVELVYGLYWTGLRRGDGDAGRPAS